MKDLKKIKPEEKEKEDKFKYPASEDIYYHANETNIDPDALIETGILQPKKNHIEKSDNLPGNGLDVPGSSQDDEQEKIGSEDEENNYYSLGGDNHDD
jgi:hypothetical protein